MEVTGLYLQSSGQESQLGARPVLQCESGRKDHLSCSAEVTGGWMGWKMSPSPPGRGVLCEDLQRVDVASTWRARTRAVEGQAERSF